MGRNKTRIKVVIADDHDLFREGVKTLLHPINDICVVGEAADGRALVELYKELNPDVIVVDIAMPVMSGTNALREIHKIDPGARALFLSMHTSEQFILSCMQAGGMGLLSKSSTSSELRSAIRAVYEGEEFYSSKISKEYIEELRAQLDGYRAVEVVSVDFDEREKNVLRLVAEGKKSAEIAEQLQIGKRTIDWVRSRLMSKLALESSAELVQFAVKYVSGLYGSRTDERKMNA